MADRSRRVGRSHSAQPAGKDPVRRGQIRRSLPGAIQDQELMLEQKRLGNDGTGTARSEQASQGSDEMDEKDDQIAHHRILAGQEIPTNYGRNNNSPATRFHHSRSRDTQLRTRGGMNLARNGDDVTWSDAKHYRTCNLSTPKVHEEPV